MVNVRICLHILRDFVLFCLFVCLFVCSFMGHFVMVLLNLTCLHCLQHAFFEYLFNLHFNRCSSFDKSQASSIYPYLYYNGKAGVPQRDRLQEIISLHLLCMLVVIIDTYATKLNLYKTPQYDNYKTT